MPFELSSTMPDCTAFLGGAPGGGELLLIFVVVLLLFGSKNIPGIARTIGKTMEEFRRAAREVRDEVVKAGEDEELQNNPPKPLPGRIARFKESEYKDAPPEHREADPGKPS